jgi:hypothetical protein
MTTWNSLPGEIHLHILRTFCAEIINEFKSLSAEIIGQFNDQFKSLLESLRAESTIDPAVQSYFDTNYEPPLAWPPAPASLKSFVAAIATCRDFNYIILHQVKFDGLCLIELLHNHQKDSVIGLTKNGHLNMKLFYQAAGCFWKNPYFLNNRWYNHFVLQWATMRSSQLLLPHLEPWVNNCVQSDERPGDDDEDMTLGFLGGAQGETMSSSGGVKWIEPGRALASVGSAWTSSCPCLAVQDVIQSPPEQWWVFWPMVMSDVEAFELEWRLVNYKEQRMYVGPNALEALVWKGRDVYDMSTWAKLTSMQEILNHSVDCSVV